MVAKKTMSPKDLDGLIFDLDGVLTDTRDTHMDAWRKLFDAFFAERGVDDSMSDEDYKRYIDGKPRYDGVESFLASRSIRLPYGNPQDDPGNDTVCALGNRKNELFRKKILEDGADVYYDALEKLRIWRSAGIRTAVVSSSRNCKLILESTGIGALFDVRIDGVVSAERNLGGKPEPDIFIEAARELDALPERCMVFEDAISGVQAGQHGFFGLVVGVARFDNKEELLRNGADMCIDDFRGFDLFGDEQIAGYFNSSRPMVFSRGSGVFDLLAGKKPVFFLDYDGTLTPIVQRPEDAVMNDDMRETLKDLARHFTVAVITGRDREDVKKLIGLDQLIYSGSHGYVTSGPGGLYMEHEKSDEIREKMDKVERDLHALFDGQAEGVQIDRKQYAIAVHYRNASEKEIPYVHQVVEKILEKEGGLKKGEGKMVVEIKPDIDWHKGKALLWIYEALGFDKDQNSIPVFIGDDVTDEDAFRAIKDNGLGILVENRGQETAASHSLKNVFQVRMFFMRVMSNKKIIL